MNAVPLLEGGGAWRDVERAVGVGRVLLTWGEAHAPGSARWRSGCFAWGAVAARLGVAESTPDKGALGSPWVSGWVWSPGEGKMYGRSNADAVGLGALVLDVDDVEGVGAGDVAASEAWKARLRLALGPDTRALVWPSRSWGSKAGVRHKALVPLARSLPLHAALPWVAALGPSFAALGVELDPACLALGQGQALPCLPRHPRAPSLEVWPSEPSEPWTAWAKLPPSAWPGAPLDPSAPGRLVSLAQVEAEVREASEGPLAGVALDGPFVPLPHPSTPPSPVQAGGVDAKRAERRARARLQAWGRATVDATVDKIRASHWGGRKRSLYRGGLWLHSLAHTQAGPLGPALDVSEVAALMALEGYGLGLPSSEVRNVLKKIERTGAKRGGVELPDLVHSILRDFYAEGGR